MTLATRCSACGTSFRVVQDQLKVSGGWVRCGRCNEVFNALESLYEIEAQGHASVAAPTPAATPATSASPKAATPPPPPTAPAFDDAAAAPASPALGLWGRRPTPVPPATASPEGTSGFPNSVQNDAPAVPANFETSNSGDLFGQTSEDQFRGKDVDRTEIAAGQISAQPIGPAAWVPFGGVWPSAEGGANRAGSESLPSAHNWNSEGAAVAPEVVPSPGQADLAQSEPAEWDDRPVHGFEDVETRLEPRPGEDIGATPSFLRHSQQQAVQAPDGHPQRWALAAVALGLLLCLQGALAWRDSLAARLPVLEPLLSVACIPFGCTVTAPRNLAALALEGSNLKQRGGVGSGYEITVALRNRTAASVMWPSFELTLTDNQGQALIRRVLTPQDFGVREGRLGPAAEYNLNSQLDVADRRIAGYTVEIFYP